MVPSDQRRGVRPATQQPDAHRHGDYKPGEARIAGPIRRRLREDDRDRNNDGEIRFGGNFIGAEF